MVSVSLRVLFIVAVLRAADAFLANGIIPRTLSKATSTVGHRALRLVTSPLALRAQTGTEDLSEEDKAKGKKLADAWIKSDKVNECKAALQGSSVYLFGLPGCRSKDIGLAMARRLETYRFLDVVEVMGAAVDKPDAPGAPALIADLGAEAFREVEAAVLDQIQGMVRCVVACDPGVVRERRNWAKLQQGIVVRLQASSAELSERSGLSTQELGEMEEELGELMAQADVHVTLQKDAALDELAVSVMEATLDTIQKNPPKRKEWEETHQQQMAEWEAKQEKKEKKEKKKGFGN